MDENKVSKIKLEVVFKNRTLQARTEVKIKLVQWIRSRFLSAQFYLDMNKNVCGNTITIISVLLDYCNTAMKHAHTQQTSLLLWRIGGGIFVIT